VAEAPRDERVDVVGVVVQEGQHAQPVVSLLGLADQGWPAGRAPTRDRCSPQPGEQLVGHGGPKEKKPAGVLNYKPTASVKFFCPPSLQRDSR
jgi:hypothetical protein